MTKAKVMNEFFDAEGLAKEMDYPMAIFYQINRVNEALSVGRGSFIDAVRALEAMTSWLSDKRFVKSIQDLNEWKNQEESKVISQKGGLLNSDERGILADYYIRLYKITISLLGRKRVLGEMSVEDRTIV
jgi:hypothetical protein